MLQKRLSLLAVLCIPLLASAAPPELPPATQQTAAPFTGGTNAAGMAPLPIEPPPPATTPLLPAAPSGPSRGKGGAAPSGAPTAGTLAPRSFDSLDSDADGSLTPAEAGADPILRENFAGFDSNGDGRLSRDEFASYQPGPGDAAGD
ncbi:hypothetical protein NC00_07195 [Xanthomonas cannabis pv. phaseoli]|uniref:EF-hand domain-containing protein n=1 Tax=Xanthomonas cannabis pv. phaseoli TaxID=1885902 RepID=A0AB34PAB5_9XANT|nr:hypothetical protein NC00_07195 [Xanthomonas cannabis pv. phaseoli]